MSLVSFSSSWKVQGRAVRAVMQAIGGHEVYDQSAAGDRLVCMVDSLAPATQACKVCGCNMGGKLALFSADVDQAFESCQGSNVSKAWSWAAKSYRDRFATDVVQIRRGKRFESRVGGTPWSRGWWLLKLHELSRALLAAASLTLAVLGDTVVQLHGMSIGGSMSSSAVSVRFAEEESRAFQGQSCCLPGFEAVQRGDLYWLRYVDDVLAASRCICAGCLERFFSAVFTEPLSVVYSSSKNAASPCVWLHFELYVVGQGLSWTLKNCNRAYLLGAYSSPFVPAFLPWSGAMPYHFKQLRSMLISRLARAWSSHLSVMQSSLCIRELLLELHRLQYPLDLLRALVHSTPTIPAALLARQVFRSFLSVVGSSAAKRWKMGKGADGRGSAREGQGSSGNHRQEWRRGREKQDREKSRHTLKPRRRSSSSSSSSSTRERRSRRVKSARSFLEKEDPEFQSFVKAKEDREQELAYKRQGELLAGVLKEKFDDAILSGSGGKVTSSPSGSGGQCPGQAAAPSGAFTDAQMEQLKVLLASNQRGPPVQDDEDDKVQASSKTLRPVHVSLVSALFGGRFKVSTNTTLKEFKSQIEKKWSQRPVVEAIGSFLKDHAKDTKVPKGKMERVELFWSVLKSLD